MNQKEKQAAVDRSRNEALVKRRAYLAHQRRRRTMTVLGAIAIFFILISSVFFVFMQGATASPVSVVPVLRSAEATENFEAYTPGMTPDYSDIIPWYNYDTGTGGFGAMNEDVGAYNNLASYLGAVSMRVMGTEGTYSTFLFNESKYFSIDFKVLMRPDSGTIHFYFDNDTYTGSEIYITVREDLTNYDNALDLNNDGSINEDDAFEIVLHLSETGAPGWIRPDLNHDGTIDYIDVSMFTAQYSLHVTTFYDVGISTPAMTLGGVTYPATNAIIFNYTNSIIWSGFPSRAAWMHLYLQFEYGQQSGFDVWTCDGFAYRLENTGVPSAVGWTSAQSGTYAFFYGLGFWDRLKIMTNAGDRVGYSGYSYCYIDDLTVCYTPYPMTDWSQSPVNGSSVDPDGACSPTITASVSFDINGPTPLFAYVSDYQYDIPGSTTEQIDFTPSADVCIERWGVDYMATNNNTAGNYIFPSSATSMLMGQEKVVGVWKCYRPLLWFDTSSLPDNAVITDARIIATLVEPPNVTSGRLAGNMGWLYAYSLFDSGYDYPVTMPAPAGFNPNDNYGFASYDIQHMGVFFEPTDTSFVVPVDTSDVSLTNQTKCALAERHQVHGDSDYDNANLVKILSSDSPTGKPVLRVTYHVPSMTWGLKTIGASQLIKDKIPVILAPFDVEYSTTYQWYTNVTTLGFNHTYSWEYPAGGTNIGNKYCYSFTTNAYPEPSVSTEYPVNNTVGVSPVALTLSVHYISPVNASGWVQFMYLSAAHVWVDYGSPVSCDNDTDVSVLFSPGSYGVPSYVYGVTMYWRVLVSADCFGALDNEYPNATQNGTYVWGHKAWRFTYEVDDPPRVVSYSPAANTHFNPWVDTIYINMSDNNTQQPVWWNLFFIQETLLANGSTEDALNFIIEDNYLLPDYIEYPFVNGTLNFTWTPQDTFTLGYVFPMNGTNFSWAVQLKDGTHTVEYPSSGRHYPTPSNTHVGDWFVNYTVDWLSGNALPTVSITYPVHDAHYTKAQWRKNHDLRIITADAEGDDIFLSLSVVADGNLTLAKTFPLSRTKTYFDPGYYDDPLPNGTYTFDLSYYIPYDNMNYTLTVLAEDSAHPRPFGASTLLRFTIGSPPGAQHHLAVMRFSPGDGNNNGFSSLTNGVYGYVAMNTAPDPTSAQYCLFVSDGVSTHMTGIQALAQGYNYYPLQAYTVQNDLNYGHYPWTKIAGHYTNLVSRHQYLAYFGIYQGTTSVEAGLNEWGGLFGKKFQNYGITGTFEFDNLYDDTLVADPDFRYECYNAWGARYIVHPSYGNAVYTFQHGDYQFFGGRMFFATYPVGENANGLTWGQNNIVKWADSIGFGYSGIVITLAIVGAFLIIPYVLIRRKAKNVPTPVLVTFGFFGFLLSYGIGFIPFWVFVVPFIILLLVIVYKAIAWATSRKQLLEDSGGGP